MNKKSHGCFDSRCPPTAQNKPPDEGSNPMLKASLQMRDPIPLAIPTFLNEHPQSLNPRSATALRHIFKMKSTHMNCFSRAFSSLIILFSSQFWGLAFPFVF